MPLIQAKPLLKLKESNTSYYTLHCTIHIYIVYMTQVVPTMVLTMFLPGAQYWENPQKQVWETPYWGTSLSI